MFKMFKTFFVSSTNSQHQNFCPSSHRAGGDINMIWEFMMLTTIMMMKGPAFLKHVKHAKLCRSNSDLLTEVMTATLQQKEDLADVLL